MLPDADDKLIIMNRRQMHKLRTMKMMSNEAKVRHLKEESFYYTADGSATRLAKHLKSLRDRSILSIELRFTIKGEQLVNLLNKV